MKGPTPVIVESLAAILEKGFRIIDSQLEENVFVVISQEDKYLSFSDKREERRN